MNCPKKKKIKKTGGGGGGGVEVLGGLQIKRPGNVMNCPEKNFFFLKPGGVKVLGVNILKVRKTAGKIK